MTMRWGVLLGLVLGLGAPRAWAAGTFIDCRQQVNLACANGAQSATEDISTTYNFTGSLTLFTADGTTADANKITIALSADPVASFTATVPGDAASAMGKAVSCSAGTHVSSFSATSGAFTCSSDSVSSLAWSGLTDPTGNLALSMAARTTTFTWGNATGASTDMFTLTDTSSNSGTGYVVNLHTASSSAAKPVKITAGGTANGVDMTTAGLLEPIGTGGIKATTVTTGALSAALTWNELCTASPCTLAGTPRTTDTLLAFWRGVKQRRVTSCGGMNEYTLSSNTFTMCDSTGVGSGADSVQVVYEL
jgi:hypothetical protein